MTDMKRAYLYMVILAAFVAPFGALAAEVTLTPSPKTVGIGDTVAITVSVDTVNALNSFSGVLTYDPAFLTPVSISDGNSISSLWLERPKAGATSTPFTGFAAGGFVGQGELFTIVFKAHAAGSAQMSLANMQFLQNDGQGTAEPVNMHPLTLSVTGNSSGGYEEPADTNPPESFTLTLGKDTAVFDNAAYLAFAPVDKGSGIDRVEVGETRWPFISPAFRPADSPYELKDQYLTSRVVVRAYDRAGNARTEVFPRTHIFRPYELGILGTLGGAILALLLWLYLKRRSRA